MRVIYDREAEDEVVDAAHWYEQKSPGLGEDFVTAVSNCARALPERLVHRKHPIHGQFGVMTANVRRFPYRVFYVVEESAYVVFAVAHNGRHPDYWVHRLRPRSTP